LITILVGIIVKKNILLSLTTLCFISACSTTPTVLKGEFSNISASAATSSHVMDKTVRWSGLIIKTHNQKTRTCFEIIEMENNKSSLRPKRIIKSNNTSSRFLACKEGFMEPIAFNKRLVTITGDIVAYTKQNIGDYETEYPVVKSEIIYIWQKQPRVNYMAYPSYIPLHFNCYMSLFPGFCY